MLHVNSDGSLFLFLCVQGGELVAMLREANAPLLQRMIVEELAKEKKVLEQNIKRIVVSSTILQTCSSHIHPELHDITQKNDVTFFIVNVI